MPKLLHIRLKGRDILKKHCEKNGIIMNTYCVRAIEAKMKKDKLSTD